MLAKNAAKHPPGLSVVKNCAAIGFCPTRLKRLEGMLRGYVQSGKLAGISAYISRNDDLLLSQSFGHADIAANKPIVDDTVFRIYSLSKPITAAALMILFEEGKLLLTDAIGTYLPELNDLRVFTENSSQVERLSPEDGPTIGQLLTHTGGFCYGQGAHPVDDLYRKSNLFQLDGTIGDMVKRLGDIPLKFHPGSGFEYSISYDVLGRLIEVVSGQPLDRFMKTRLFEPLCMQDTGFEVPAEKADRLSAMYAPPDKTAPDGSIIRSDDPAGDRFAAPVTFFAGGEGLVSTVPDCLRFLRMMAAGGMLDGNRILSRKTVELMTMNHLSAQQRSDFWMCGYGYGLGFGVLVDPAANKNLGSPGEFGWAGSANTYFWVDPAEGLISLLFAQYTPSSEFTIARQFKALMYQALL